MNGNFPPYFINLLIKFNWNSLLQDDCLNVVDLEHSYSRPWNWGPENVYARPMKTLFMNKCQADRYHYNTNKYILTI